MRSSQELSIMNAIVVVSPCYFVAEVGLAEFVVVTFLDPKSLTYSSGIDKDNGNYKKPCRDLCKEVNMHGIQENCYACEYKCKYDANGKLLGKAYDNGSDLKTNPKKLGCCPGTTLDCAPPKGSSVIGSTCPTCAQCGWFCDCSHGKWNSFPSYDVFFPGSDVDVRDLGVPCCNGQDPKNPPPVSRKVIDDCWYFSQFNTPC